MEASQVEFEHPRKAFGWAARDSSGLLSPFNFSRRDIGEEDVALEVLYCGICHTDLHMAKNDFGNSIYPYVPGHEVIGIVAEVGSKVEKYKVGDKVGVGYFVESCRSCQNCIDNLENYCPKHILTQGDKHIDGTTTYGGYSDSMVVDEHFVTRIPEGLPLDGCGSSSLCWGYSHSPLKYYGLDKPGLHVGVVGLGGLGHMVAKFAKTHGLKITVISTSPPTKKEEAIKNLGADSFLVSRDPDQMEAPKETLDGIIDTVSADHSIVPLIGLLKSHGKLVLIGAIEKPLELPPFPLILGRKLVGGTLVGGLKETQEMIDFSPKHNVKPEIEVVPMDYVNIAMQRLAKADVKYRFVIDVANTLKPTS
uniref:Probable mannitol dehydrogenase 3 n=1 Tax=Stylosanthes humilis TaxID=35628 RepID=MTDH3_STYHU|nr:RecName: Full=Probable mannitol dehydrogenase 3; AltName: Full=NAD-dependent mannitol dehydrogenase 3 [Stylosanthes humilis]AAA74883.1 cinnamyl-alcohol dehydrogenase [Stylosanthes humilis]